MSVSPEKLVLQAPAKVNLSLRILGRRPDGYHNLDTVMQKLDLADTVTLRCRKALGIQLSCPDSDLPENGSNLAWKAAALFLEETKLEHDWGVSIVLEKKIPIAAGLGGGSSDAGTVLIGLDRMFKTGLSQETLIRLGRSLGADVPFFVVPYSAVRATGIGDKMTPHDPLVGSSLLLANPGFSVSTSWAYKNYTLTRTDKGSSLSDSRKNERFPECDCLLYNDLEAVTIEHYPELMGIQRFLLDNGATGALMSGSGPTVFGVFMDQKDGKANEVQQCSKKLSEKYRCDVFVTRSLVVN